MPDDEWLTQDRADGGADSCHTQRQLEMGVKPAPVLFYFKQGMDKGEGAKGLQVQKVLGAIAMLDICCCTSLEAWSAKPVTPGSDKNKVSLQEIRLHTMKDVSREMGWHQLMQHRSKQTQPISHPVEN